MEILARVLYAFDHDPLLIFKGTKYLFDTDEVVGKYWTVFGEDGHEIDMYDERRLNKTISLFFIWTKLEELVKQKAKNLVADHQEDTIPYQALLAKWHFLWAYGYLLNKFYGNQLESLYRRIANGKVFEREDNFINKWFSRIHNKISKSIEQEYKSDDDESIQGFNLKNWLRNASDFEKLKREFKYTEKEDFPIDYLQNS